MSCASCGKRGALIGAAAKRLVQGKPIMPLVRGVARTVRADAQRIIKPIAPRLGRPK